MSSQLSSDERPSVPKGSQFSTLREQRLELRKKQYVGRSTTPIHVRPLLAIEDVVRYALLRSGIDSRVVTFAWFLVGLSAHAVTAVGALWSFVAGAILVHTKIILDIADGEIGRYRKRFMSQEEDVASHMKGIYLDRVQHAIESPLWGLALGIGAYRLTENQWMLACGLSVAVFRSFWRFDALLQKHIIDTFQERLAAIKQNGLERLSKASSDHNSCLPVRLFEKSEFWLRNGKRFNLLILVCGGADWILNTRMSTAPCIQSLLYSASVVCLCSIVVRVISVQYGKTFARAGRR